MNQKLHDSMDYISDAFLEGAVTPRKRRYYPFFGAIAAVLALVIAIAAFFGPLRGIFDPGSSTTVPVLQNSASTFWSSLSESTYSSSTIPATQPSCTPSTGNSIETNPSYPSSTKPSYNTYPSYRPPYSSSMWPTYKPTTVPSAATHPAVPPSTTTVPRPDATYGLVAAPVYMSSGGSSVTYPDNTGAVLSEIANNVLADSTGKNTVCSPLNIYMALSMLAQITDGSSQQQILDALGQADMTALRSYVNQLWKDHYKNENYKTVLANSLWLDDRISYNQETADMLALYYFASVYHGPLSSSNMQESYKAWLNKETGGLLKHQIDKIRISPDAIMLLASTVYYQANWTSAFKESSTTPGNFYSPTTTIAAMFMNKTIMGADYYVGTNCQAVRLKLNDGSYAWLTLPDKGVDPLSATDFYRNAGPVQPVELVLSVPCFDITATTDLRNALNKMGITDIFTSEADFSPITSNDTLPLRGIEHTVRVAVDEGGVTGAAYTTIPVPGSPPPGEYPVVHLTFDRPFTFSIVSSEGLPLFTGIVNNPTA